MESLTVKAPAKVNLRLEILKKRSDGYHEISTIFQKVGLFDELTLQKCPGRGITLTADTQDIPLDRTNLIVRAAELLLHDAGLDCGVAAHLHKRIPVGAGLGGGSSDAAATLEGLAALFNLKTPPGRLRQLGLSLGADVPFFLSRYGTACATGIGELLRPAGLNCPLWFVIVFPRFSVSTAWAYSAYSKDHLLTNHQKNINITNSISDIEQVCLLLHNDFERVVIPRHPEIAEIKRYLMHTGAKGALLSGSGSSVFGIFESVNTCAKASQQLALSGRHDVFTVQAL